MSQLWNSKNTEHSQIVQDNNMDNQSIFEESGINDGSEEVKSRYSIDKDK